MKETPWSFDDVTEVHDDEDVSTHPLLGECEGQEDEDGDSADDWPPQGPGLGEVPHHHPVFTASAAHKTLLVKHLNTIN